MTITNYLKYINQFKIELIQCYFNSSQFQIVDLTRLTKYIKEMTIDSNKSSIVK